MKFFLLLNVLITLVSLSLFGQRIDEQKHSFSYLRLPLAPLQGEFTSYSVRVDQGTVSLSSMGLIRSQIPGNFFPLEAYELKPSEGDFEILITLDGDFLAKRERKSKTTTVGKGDDAKTVTTYFYEVSFRVPITYQISDGKRNVMIEEIYFSYDNLKKKNFGDAKSTRELDSQWANNGDLTMNKWVKAELSARLKALGAHLSSQIDTKEVTTQVPFYSIKKAEKIGYEDMAARMSEVKPIIAMASAEKVLTLEDFGTLIEDWKAALQNADPDHKKESVAFQAAGYNLAMANALSGNYGDALTFADKIGECSKRDYLKRNATRFIESLKARFVANQNIENLYHDTFDKESAALNAPPVTATAPVVVPENQHIGYVILHSEGDTIDGILHYDYVRKGTASSTAVTLKGIRVENAAKRPSSRYFRIEEIASAMDNDNFMVPVEIGAGPIGVVTIQKVIHTVDGLWLTQILYKEDYSYCLLRIVLNRKGEPKRKVYLLNGGLSFVNLNNGLKNKFEDCPAIFAKAEAGEYQKTETSFLQILEDYDGCEPDLD